MGNRCAVTFAALLLAVAAAPAATEPAPAERTVVVGIEVDRFEARLLAFTVKPRPWRAPDRLEAVRAAADDGPVQLEIVAGSGRASIVQRVEIPGLCLAHGPDALPHVEGDTIRVHRDAVLVELPERADLDRLEVAYHVAGRAGPSREVLGTLGLDATHYTRAAGPLGWVDVAFADQSQDVVVPATSGSVTWPEDHQDPDVWRIWGDAAQASQRINIVIVPDGYTYASKALMESHAAAMVAHFRQKTPYAEHDPFINYVLVYAYSTQDGTDQCDCGTVVDTAMGTRFPNAGDPCGGSGNRCLYYGGACDVDSTAHIVQAELRAPVRDATLVMVNTTRYGGCGGSRAVYSAGNSSATEIAVHELGHSLAGLADEYAGNPSCGSSGGEINTSTNATIGAWPEWIAEIGAPRQGARYYDQCIYRPLPNCDMRSLWQPFCPVCNQRWSLVFFGHSRVAPTAPISSASPAPPQVDAWTGVPVDFSVVRRLSNASSKTTWTLREPGASSPVTIASGVAQITRTFNAPGVHQVTCDVVADTNFIKESRWGANRDVVTWNVNVETLAPPVEVSPPGAAAPLRFESPSSLSWEDASGSGAFTYNLYRGALSALGGGSWGSCLHPGLETNGDTDTAIPAEGAGWFYLVSGENPAGEGPLGDTSAGVPRVPAATCP